MDGELTEIKKADTLSIHNEDPKKGDIKEIVSNSDYRRILVYIGLTTLVTVTPVIILPAFGARWFANCENSNDNCEYDYETYNFYESLFRSIRAIVSLMFSAFVSSLSDLYGRKPLLLVRLLVPTINVLLIIVYPNLFIYWSLNLFNALLSPGIFGGGPISRAYISDVIEKQNLRTNAFALSAAFRTLFLIVGSITAAVITNIANIELVWIVMLTVRIFVVIYTILVIKESITTSQIRSNKMKIEHKSLQSRCNPLKPLFYVTRNPVILWLAIMTFFQQISQVFVPVFLIYVNDQMHIENDSESTILNMIIFVSVSIFGVIYIAVLIPCFKRTFSWASDINICIIGSVFQVAAPLIWSFIPFVVNNYGQNYYLWCIVIIISGCACFSFMAFVEPPLSGITSKYISDNEHGMAFGILSSYRMVATIIGPFGFGYCYNVSNDIGFPSLMNYILAGFLFISSLIALFPLRQTIKKLEKTGEIYTFHYDQKPLMEASMGSAKVPMDDETPNTNYVTYNEKIDKI